MSAKSDSMIQFKTQKLPLHVMHVILLANHAQDQMPINVILVKMDISILQPIHMFQEHAIHVTQNALLVPEPQQIAMVVAN